MLTMFRNKASTMSFKGRVRDCYVHASDWDRSVDTVTHIHRERATHSVYSPNLFGCGHPKTVVGSLANAM